MPKNAKESNVMKIVFSRKELSQKLKLKPQNVKTTTIMPETETSTGILIGRTPFKRTVDEKHFDATDTPDSEFEVTGVLISHPFDLTTSMSSDVLSATEKSAPSTATTEESSSDETVGSGYCVPTTRVNSGDYVPLSSESSEMVQNTEDEKSVATTGTTAVPEEPTVSSARDAQTPSSVSDITASLASVESTTQIAAFTVDSIVNAVLDTTQASSDAIDASTDPNRVDSNVADIEIASVDEVESSPSTVATSEAADDSPIAQTLPEPTPVSEENESVSPFDVTTAADSNVLSVTEESVATTAAPSETTNDQNREPATGSEMAQDTENDQIVAITPMAGTSALIDPYTNNLSDGVIFVDPVEGTTDSIVGSNMATTEVTSATQETQSLNELLISTEDGFGGPAIDPENVGAVQIMTAELNVVPENTERAVDTTPKSLPATHTTRKTPHPKQRQTTAPMTASAPHTTSNPSVDVAASRNALNFFGGSRVFKLCPILAKAASNPSPSLAMKKSQQSQTTNDTPSSNKPFFKRLFKAVGTHPNTKTLFPPRQNGNRQSASQNLLSTIWNFNGPLFEPKKIYKRETETDFFVTPSPRRRHGSRKNIIDRLHEETSIEKAERRHKAVERLMHVATIAGHFDSFLTGRLKHGVKTLHKIFNTDEDTRTRY